MTFWGYNNEEEARKYWPNLDKGQRWTEKRHRDNGEEYLVIFIIIGKNKIGF